MTVRRYEPADRAAVLALMAALWADFDGEDDDLERGDVLVWTRVDGTVGGFLSYSWPPFVEGWYVAPELRGHGVGRALMAAMVQVARTRGYGKLRSDVAVGNAMGLAAHRALGFVGPPTALHLELADRSANEGGVN